MQITIVHVNENKQDDSSINDNRLTVREALGVGHFYHLKSNTVLEPDVPIYMYKDISDGDTLYHTKFVLQTFIRNMPFILEEFLPVDWENGEKVKEWIPRIDEDVTNLVEPTLFFDGDIRQALIEKTPARLEYFIYYMVKKHNDAPSYRKECVQALKQIIDANKAHVKLLPILIEMDNDSLFSFLMESDGLALQYTSNHMRNNVNICAAAVQQNGLALQYVPQDMRNNVNICAAAVKQNGLALRYAPNDMRNNPAICLTAVQQNPNAYQYASEMCRNHPKIITNTFRPEVDLTFSPQYVPNQTRDDTGFTKFVIRNKHFKYASDEAKGNLNTARAACEIDPNAFLYVGKKLLRDVKFVAWALELEFNEENVPKRVNVRNVPKRVLHIARNYIDFTSEGNWYYGQKGTDD